MVTPSCCICDVSSCYSHNYMFLSTVCQNYGHWYHHLNFRVGLSMVKLCTTIDVKFIHFLKKLPLDIRMIITFCTKRNNINVLKTRSQPAWTAKSNTANPTAPSSLIDGIVAFEFIREAFDTANQHSLGICLNEWTHCLAQAVYIAGFWKFREPFYWKNRVKGVGMS